MSATMIGRKEKYIGDYVNTEDFKFQEQMRKSDLAIKTIIKEKLGTCTSDIFFVNGWGQLVSAAYLLENRPEISGEFEKLVSNNLELAISKGKTVDNPFSSLNVRGFTKPVMLHPTHPTHPGKYLEWKNVEIDQPVQYLNAFLKDCDFKLELHEGKIFLMIYPEGELNIFNKLWNTDFPKLLEENGYTKLEKNKESSHVTLVNSDVIAKVKDGFVDKYGIEEGMERFHGFFRSYFLEVNKGLQDQIELLQFTTLTSTYSEDYPPFEEVVVAKLNAPYVEKAMMSLIDKVEEEIGIKIPIIVKSSYHMSIATKFRKSNPYLLKEAIELILSKTGKYAEVLSGFWQQLING